MTKEVSNKKIREKLNLLQAKLPNPPGPVPKLYRVPDSLGAAVTETGFSESALQRISDHMGYFLGILQPVKIHVQNRDDYSSGRITGKGRSGLYRLSPNGHGEIWILKEEKFQLRHVLAILAHEYTHNYLFRQRLVEPDEWENEILTDTGAVFLGFGQLLLKGYQPIRWTSDWRYTSSGTQYKTHTLTLGYIKPAQIRHAIEHTARMRGIKDLSLAMPWYFRFPLIWHFWKLDREKRKVEKCKRDQAQQWESLLDSLQEALKTYEELPALLGKSTGVNGAKIPEKQARILMEIANEISIGELRHELGRMSLKLKNSSQNQAPDQGLLDQITKACGKIAEWKKTLSRYS